VRAEVQGAEDIDRHFAVETKAVEAHGRDFVAIFVESANLRYQMDLSNDFLTEGRTRNCPQIDAPEGKKRWGGKSDAIKKGRILTGLPDIGR
jgi:hypothetical protein